MLHIQRGLSILIIFALLAALLGDALPLNAAPSEAPSPHTTPATMQQEDAAQTVPVVTDTLNAPTASGPSMYLNGSSYVNVPNASLPAVGGNDLMLEAWIYPTDVTGYHAVFGKRYPF